MGETIAVIGLGKLGAPLAACLAAKGFRVIGVDADPAKVEAVNQGRAPVFETGLEEMIRASPARLRATSSVEEAVRASEVTFVVVATPSEPSGGFSLKFVLPVCRELGQALQAKKDFHLVVITSTVMPGTTLGPVRETLEQASGKRVVADFGLCYGPEFIALGSVIRDFLNPDFVLIGESDERSGELLEKIYIEVCEKKPRVARMSTVNAEITKLAVNTFVTTKISFVNMLARICERLPGANVDAVTTALGLDSRIGGKYLKGAVGYGGPCFPRDNLALAALAREIGAPADIAQATDRFNRAQVAWLADLVQQHLPAGGTAGILGLTYKPDTDVVEQSVGLILAQELVRRGAGVVAYDPAGMQNARNALGDSVRLAASARECIERSAVVVLATPWKEFLELPEAQWSDNGRALTLVDCWRAISRAARAKGVRYLSLGTGTLDAISLQKAH